MKAVNKKLEDHNKLLAEAIKNQTRLIETLRHDNSEVLRVKKDINKILELICEEKILVTSNNK